MLDQIRRRVLSHNPRYIEQELAQAGVLIAITNEQDPHVILTKRASQLSSHSGEIAFPGGKRDEDDRDILFTALREAEEEVALKSQDVEVIGRMNEVISLHQLKVTPWLGIISPHVVLQASPFELDCIFRVPLSYFLDQNNRCDDREEYQAKAKFAPCYLFEGHLIWGLTAYMLIEFLNLAFDADIPLNPRSKMKGEFKRI